MTYSAKKFRRYLLRIPYSKACLLTLEPIQEVEIHGQTFDLVKRRSMMRIMARRMKATTVVA